MLLLDVNVVVHAHRWRDAEEAAQIREWLNARLVGGEPLGISELVLSAMIRIVTNGRIFRDPTPPAQALEFAQALLDAPAAVSVRPGARQWPIFSNLVATQRLRANDVPDAYLAAMAMERGATFVTRDGGFGRFPGLRLLDPLA